MQALLPSWVETPQLDQAVDPIRAQAHAQLLASGLPNSKNAFWRYTDLSKWLPAMTPHLSEDALMAFDHDGVRVSSEAIDEAFQIAGMPDGLWALHWAQLRHVIKITVPAHTSVDLSALWPRLVPHLQGSNVAMLIDIQSYAHVTWHMDMTALTAAPWQHLTCQWRLGEHAHLQLVETPGDAIRHHIRHHQYHQQAFSTVRFQAGQWGGDRSRCVIESFLQGEGAECHAHALLYGQGEAVHDWVARCEHMASRTHSEVRAHALLDDSAQMAFNVKTRIAKDCGGCSAHQHNKNSLLSKRAKIHAKPAFEIHTDQVTCSHGSTTGALSQDALFALRSRGIHEIDARQLLQLAFVRDLVDQLDDSRIRQQWLAALALPSQMEGM